MSRTLLGRTLTGLSTQKTVTWHVLGLTRTDPLRGGTAALRPTELDLSTAEPKKERVHLHVFYIDI